MYHEHHSCDDLNSELMPLAAKVLRAYLACSDELQAQAKEMIAIYTGSDDEQEREVALHTLWEILFPERDDCGVALEHLDECDPAGQADLHRIRRELDAEEELFAAKLEARMRDAGLTQADLAKRAGVGQPAISMMLKRKCRPQRRTVVKLAEALGVSPADLWIDAKRTG